LWRNNSYAGRNGNPREDVDHSARVALREFNRVLRKERYNMKMNSPGLEPTTSEPE
jgi:hypothetical protein